MKDPEDVTFHAALRERLLFLAEMGVTDLRVRRRPGPAAVVVTHAAPSVSATVSDAEERLASLRQEIGECVRCRLSEKRTRIVFGAGNSRARLMFVGEGPGYDEDRQGLPFVGRAGQLLNRIIESIGMKRDDVYIANVVKCRPPENRTPLPDEIATCSPFLLRQIEAIRPQVVCALGGVAVQTLLGTSAPISRVRGEFRSLPDGTLVMPTFHPAYLLRNPDKKKEVWEDMKKIREVLSQAEPS
ncbi:MAG TPA: uracil-DNA glycosylase [Candidatus Polarisedimenticolia bacterium]|nr:uracil-DNA glycosylase [Candidatus Polarisedimenticolia bacterium]